MEEAKPRDMASAVFWEEMDRVSTTFPGKIINVRDNGLVDVQPSVKVRFKGESTDTLMPIINNVVLMHMRSECGIIRMPVEKLKNTKVCVFISEHSLEDWREKKGEPSLPTDGRRFNRNDAVAIIGLYPETVPWQTTQKPKTLEVQFSEDCKGYFGNTKGDDLFNLTYNLINYMSQGVNTSTGQFTQISKITQILATLAKITNVTTL